MVRRFIQYTAVFFLLVLFFTSINGCAFLTKNQRLQVEGLQEETMETMVRVKEKTRETPESVLNESITSLISILAYTEEVKKDPAEFNDDLIESYALKIRIINENIDRIKDLTLETDVSFPLGTYKLFNISRAARTRLDELATEVARTIVELDRQYPGNKLNLVIKSVGYTDETVVLPGTQLAKKITAELAPDKLPKGRVERRQTFNRVLSRYRAASLNEYVAKQVEKQTGSKYDYSVEAMVIGKGEALPGKEGGRSFTAKDPRRRICLVSPFVEVVP